MLLTMYAIQRQKNIGLTNFCLLTKSISTDLLVPKKKKIFFLTKQGHFKAQFIMFYLTPKTFPWFFTDKK